MTGIAAALSMAVGSTLTVTDFPTDVTGYGNSGAAANITTGLVVATPSGGIPAYTYLWAQIGISPYTWTIGSAAAASTDFTCHTLGPGNSADATFEVTVTDSVGATARAQVTAFANNGLPYDPRPSRSSRDFL